MVMTSSIQWRFFGRTSGRAGLAQGIAGERHAWELAFGEVALDRLFVGDVGGDFGRVVGGSAVSVGSGHRKSSGMVFRVNSRAAAIVPA
jgi:hypothetical protein